MDKIGDDNGGEKIESAEKVRCYCAKRNEIKNFLKYKKNFKIPIDKTKKR